MPLGDLVVMPLPQVTDPSAIPYPAPLLAQSAAQAGTTSAIGAVVLQQVPSGIAVTVMAPDGSIGNTYTAPDMPTAATIAHSHAGGMGGTLGQFNSWQGRMPAKLKGPTGGARDRGSNPQTVIAGIYPGGSSPYGAGGGYGSTGGHFASGTSQPHGYTGAPGAGSGVPGGFTDSRSWRGASSSGAATPGGGGGGAALIGAPTASPLSTRGGSASQGGVTMSPAEQYGFSPNANGPGENSGGYGQIGGPYGGPGATYGANSEWGQGPGNPFAPTAIIPDSALPPGLRRQGPLGQEYPSHPNWHDGRLLSEARLWMWIALHGGLKSVCRVPELGNPIWDSPNWREMQSQDERYEEPHAIPDTNFQVNPVTGLNTGNYTGLDYTIYQFRVPLGYDGVINRFVCGYSGAGFSDFSGNIVWRVKINARYARNLGNVVNTYSSVSSNFAIPDIDIIRLVSGQTVQLIANIPVGSPVSGGMVMAGVFGWFTPRR